MRRKAKTNSDMLSTVITITAIATLAVTAAAAAVAYILHDRYCRSRQLVCTCETNEELYEPLVPDDDEIEF